MATDNKQRTRVTFERLQAFIAGALQRVGLPEADASRVASLMAQADLQGSDGHGVIRLAPYVKRIRAGGMNPRPQMRVVHERAGCAVIDGDIPTAEEPPVVLDMATTVAAYGKVKAKAKAGELMPEGWMIDRQGKPLTDPKRADEGFLLPIGAHKGYGLALIVGLLAGTLQGAAMGRDVIDFNKDFVTKTNTGQAMLVIDLRAFGDPAQFKAAVDRVVRDLRNSERLDGVERIWLPGEQSHLRREHNRAHGIPLSAGVVTELAALAAELGIAPLL